MGVGGGVMTYRFRQAGDFVNQTTFAVFKETYESSGAAPMFYGNVGAEYTLSTRIGLVGDVRYINSRARLGDTFAKFDRIDLSGTSATMGLAFRY